MDSDEFDVEMAGANILSFVHKAGPYKVLLYGQIENAITVEETTKMKYPNIPPTFYTTRESIKLEARNEDQTGGKRDVVIEIVRTNSSTPEKHRIADLDVKKKHLPIEVKTELGTSLTVTVKFIDTHSRFKTIIPIMSTIRFVIIRVAFEEQDGRSPLWRGKFINEEAIPPQPPLASF